MTALGTRSIADRVAEVQQRVQEACDRAGRSPSEVTVVGVTKTVAADRIREALDAGLSHLGENRLQEAVPKMRELASRAPTWHFIGHLQRNKARKAAELFDRIETLDSTELADILEAATEEIGRDLRVFAQVNLGRESSKHGVAPDDLDRLLSHVDALPRLTVTGLLAIPPRRESAEAAREDFARLRELFDRMRADRPAMRHLSMGMSADFEVAIEEGATEVRVGTILFGERARGESPAGETC